MGMIHDDNVSVAHFTSNSEVLSAVFFVLGYEVWGFVCQSRRLSLPLCSFVCSIQTNCSLASSTQKDKHVGLQLMTISIISTSVFLKGCQHIQSFIHVQGALQCSERRLEEKNIIIIIMK